MDGPDNPTLLNLLSTNITPSTNQAMFIRNQVKAMASEADSIDDELLALALRTADLRARRSELDRGLEQYKRVLAPCRLIPAEILGEIFMYLVPTGGARTRTVANLCRVCKSWRDAALLVRQMWSEVAVRVHTLSPSYESIARWLSRSGTLPKALHLTGSKGKGRILPHPGCSLEQGVDTGVGDCPFSNPDLVKLLRHGPPLHTLSLRTASPRCLQKLAASIIASEGEEGQGLQSLATLSISANKWTTSWQDLPPSTFAFIPPTVETLQLRLPDIDAVDPDLEAEFNVPPAVLQRVKSLQLVCNWPDLVLEIIRHCTTTVAIHIVFGIVRTRWNFSGQGIWLSRLKALSLDGFCVAALDQLRYLRLPSLLNLSVSFGAEDDSDDSDTTEGVSYIAVDAENGETLCALILGGDLNMRPNLISLKLANVRFVGHWNANNTVFDLLKPVSSLTELTLDCVAFEDDLFERLLMTASLPNLKVLTLLHLPCPPQEILHLDDFVQARGIDLTTTQLDDS